MVRKLHKIIPTTTNKNIHSYSVPSIEGIFFAPTKININLK